MNSLAPPAEVEVGFAVAAAQTDSAQALSKLVVRLIAFVVTPLVCFGAVWLIDKEITDRAWQLAAAMAAISWVFLLWSLVAWLRVWRAARASASPPLIVSRFGVSQGALLLPWEQIQSVSWRRGRLVVQSNLGVIRVATRYLITKKATLDGILQSMSNGQCGIAGVERPSFSAFNA